LRATTTTATTTKTWAWYSSASSGSAHPLVVSIATYLAITSSSSLAQAVTSMVVTTAAIPVSSLVWNADLPGSLSSHNILQFSLVQIIGIVVNQPCLGANTCTVITAVPRFVERNMKCHTRYGKRRICSLYILCKGRVIFLRRDRMPDADVLPNEAATRTEQAERGLITHERVCPVVSLLCRVQPIEIPPANRRI